MKLAGRTALITGGTRGIGAAIAEALAANGCSVILQGLSEDAFSRETAERCRARAASFHTSARGAEEATEEAKHKSPGVHCVFADLSEPTGTSIPYLLDQVDSLEVEVDMLVNNVGTYNEPDFLDVDLGTWERTMRLNVAAGYFLTQAFARRWIATDCPGRVLFTGSINGQLAEPNHTVYDTTKGAVHSMVRSLCVALAPRGIRVNAIAPGLIRTPLTGPALEDAKSLKWMELHTPNGEVPEAASCAGAAVFLLSDEAEHVHGQTLFVDGGMSAWQQPDCPPE
jgi:NAD(P)-dependent dehydrogenase (short-subunit alcohol dehydrogenase family)